MITSLKTCNREFKKFIQRMKNRYENFKYVAVMSRQDNGNWHYHMVCNLGYIAFNELKQIWGLGGVFIGKIRNKTQLSRATSYASKNTNNARLYLKGQNLSQDIIKHISPFIYNELFNLVEDKAGLWRVQPKPSAWYPAVLTVITSNAINALAAVQTGKTSFSA
ncbi:hypothetical protein TEPIDINF_002211 [Tepidibacillus infernus]|uniref:rolling circle replication-associated protein n=1 Tax=Tepidibacillus infernus TaxID=1806172 RepID=UPI003A24E88B